MGRHRRHGHSGGIDAGYEFLTFLCVGLTPASNALIFLVGLKDTQLAAELAAL